MERNFNNEFERFLKENADQYRLYPSPKVWNGIYSALHTHRKWYGLGMILLLITGILVTFLITHSSKETIVNNNLPVSSKQQQVHVLPGEISSSDKRISFNKPRNHAVNLITLNNFKAFSRFHNQTADNLTLPKQAGVYNIFGNDKNNFEPLALNITDELTDQDIVNNLQANKTFDYPKSLRNTNSFDWTIESVINNFRKNARRISLQFNLTPTVSYRKLSSNKAFLSSATNAPSSYAPLYDINSAVTHKPDLGLEFGLTAKYSLATNFKVKGGLQFNINRYDIKAFNSSFEVAQISLRGNRGVDSFYAVSTHRNFNGYKSDWLHNFYFEISMPVGVEVNIAGDDKVQFGVAGTIQPTYVLGDRAYLLSSDYKNYVEVPWLTRRWNVNTGFETFVSYSTGKMKWQVGPQVRYQLLSSFIDKYPVKENLFDFGFKVGVSLTK